MVFEFFVDTGKRVRKVRKKSKKKAREARLRAFRRGQAVSKVRFRLR